MKFRWQMWQDMSWISNHLDLDDVIAISWYISCSWHKISSWPTNQIWNPSQKAFLRKRCRGINSLHRAIHVTSSLHIQFINNISPIMSKTDSTLELLWRYNMIELQFGSCSYSVSDHLATTGEQGRTQIYTPFRGSKESRVVSCPRTTRKESMILSWPSSTRVNAPSVSLGPSNGESIKVSDAPIRNLKIHGEWDDNHPKDMELRIEDFKHPWHSESLFFIGTSSTLSFQTSHWKGLQDCSTLFGKIPPR